MKYKILVRFETKENLDQFCDIINRPDLKVKQSKVKKINYKSIRDLVMKNKSLIDLFGENDELKNSCDWWCWFFRVLFM